MRIRSLIICIVGALFPLVAGAGPLTPVGFIEVSTAGAQQIGAVPLPDSQSAFNECQGNPLLCEVAPTAAMQSIFRTGSNAFTDGFGGSGLALHSRDAHVEAEAETLEDSQFAVSGHDPVDVHIHGFFPVISLVGIFAPGSELVY